LLFLPSFLFYVQKNRFFFLFRKLIIFILKRLLQNISISFSKKKPTHVHSFAHSTLSILVYHSFDQLSSISQLIFKICLFSLLTNSFRLAFSTNETFLYSVSSCMRLSHILRKYWILYNDIQSKYFPSRNTLCTCLEDLVYDWHIHCVDNGRLCLFSFDMFTVENGL